MEILILLLVSPAIFAQRYRKHVNPNDEPFLPIHPVYPQNSKLSKRGFDKEISTVFKPELFAPRTDARDSYAASYAGNLKDSFHPGYGSSPQNSGPPYSSFYGNGPFGAYPNPYTMNPYVSNPYTSGPSGPGSYPGYYNQHPYYYPDFHNGPFPYSFPPPDHSGPPGPPWNENKHSNRDSSPTKQEKSKTSKPKSKETLSSAANGSGNQYVDGNNQISQSYKDLTAQSSAHKTSNQHNQLEQIPDIYLKNLPFPQTTYKVISVGGQPVGPNYPLPSNYARAQILEQAAAVQSLAKSLGNPFSHQPIGAQNSQGISSYNPYPTTVGQQSSSFVKPDHDKFYSSQANSAGKIPEEQYYSENINPLGKSAEAHIFGSDVRDLPIKESNNQFHTPSQDSPRKLTDIDIYGDRQSSSNQNSAQSVEFVIPQGDKSSETFSQSPAALSKIVSISKYQSLPDTQKPGTKVTFQQSHSTYIPPAKIGAILEDGSDQLSVQPYDQTPVLHGGSYRTGQIYRPGQTISYQNQNPSHGAPQAFTYHQTNVHPFVQGSGAQQQIKTNLEDVNFGAKQGNKG